jgi:hypothetical protein
VDRNHSPQYRRNRTRYASDVTKAEWVGHRAAFAVSTVDRAFVILLKCDRLLLIIRLGVIPLDAKFAGGSSRTMRPPRRCSASDCAIMPPSPLRHALARGCYRSRDCGWSSPETARTAGATTRGFGSNEPRHAVARGPEHCISTSTYISPIFLTPKILATRTMVIHACHCVPLHSLGYHHLGGGRG